MWKYLFLRFLPRRILPLLALYEAVRLIRRMRHHDEPTATPVSYGLAPAPNEPTR